MRVFTLPPAAPFPLYTAGINRQQPGTHMYGCHSLELTHLHIHALTGDARRKSEDGKLILRITAPYW